MKKLILLSLLILSSQLVFANEIDSIKLDLKKDYPALTADEISTLEKVEKNKEQTILNLYLKDQIYLAFRKSKKMNWKFAEVIGRESVDLVEFKSKNRFSIYFRTGGTSHSEATSTWRLEDDQFKIIGQDSKYYSGWNTGVVESSINYLTGVIKASARSAKQKKISGKCKFDISEYRAQRLSDVSDGGAKEPECKFSEMPEI